MSYSEYLKTVIDKLNQNHGEHNYFLDLRFFPERVVVYARSKNTVIPPRNYNMPAIRNLQQSSVGDDYITIMTVNHLDFRKEEFKTGFTIDGLCEALKKDGFTIRNNSIDDLNDLLVKPDSYKMALSFQGDKKPTKSLQESIIEYEELSGEYYLKCVNRLIIEEYYPQATPKSVKKEAPLFNGFTAPLTNFYLSIEDGTLHRGRQSWEHIEQYVDGQVPAPTMDYSWELSGTFSREKSKTYIYKRNL